MAQDRHATQYPGVFYRIRKRIGGPGEERVYFVLYKKNGKTIEAKAGRQYADQMTAAKAALFRSNLLEGREATPQEKREEARRKIWNLSALFEEYTSSRGQYASFGHDRSWFEKYIRKPLGEKEPKDLAPLDMERLRRVQCKGLSAQTQKHVMGLVVRLARHGQKQGLCPGLSFIPTLPKLNNEKTEDLTPEQAKRLLDVLNSWPDQSTAGIFKLAMCSGMRRSEICKLRWQDVDFERGVIKIIEPKRGEDATIPLSETARDILLNLPESDSEFCFPGRDGGRRRSIDTANRKLRKEAGLPAGFRPCHGLRHFFASELANSGKVEMHVLQKLLTHKSAKMTQRYAHLRNEALRDAAAVADGIFKKASGLKAVK